MCVDAGIPLKPMLANICEGIPAALKSLAGTAALAEYKYDGCRAQVLPCMSACRLHIHICYCWPWRAQTGCRTSLTEIWPA